MDWLSLAASAVFTTTGGLVVWYLQSRADQLRRLEEGLRDRRLRLYSDTLDPSFRLFAGLGDAKAQAQVLARIRSYEYRKTVFELTMFGSDEVVRAYNAMFQHIYRADESEQDPREMMRLWGLVLLAIRRSGANPRSRLDEWDMLAATIKDIDLLRSPAHHTARLTSEQPDA